MGLPYFGQASLNRGFSPPLLGVLLLWGQTSVHQDLTSCFWCFSLSPPLVVFKGRHHLLHQFQLSGWRPQQSLHFVHLKVQGLDLFLASLGAYQLDSRYVCLRVQLWQFLLAASADHLLCLLLPLVCSMLEHFIEHHEVVGAIYLPLGLYFKEQLNIHHPLCLSD